VNTIAGRQGAGACINEVVSTNARPVTLSQPQLNPSNSIFFKNLYSFDAPLRCIFACENATRDAPENHLWMCLEHSRWYRHLVQLLQFLSNAKELHGYSATDTLFAPIVELSFIERFEIPQAPPSTEKNARSDECSGFDVALSVPSLRKTDRHVDHGAIVRVGQ